MSNSIDKIIDTAFSKLKAMADADTIIGKPLCLGENNFVIPISKLSVGFVAGGGEYSEVSLAGKKSSDRDFPFAGGSGTGLSIAPIAFIVVNNNDVKIFSVDQKTPLEKLYDLIPDVAKSALEKLGVNFNNDLFNDSTYIVENDK